VDGTRQALYIFRATGASANVTFFERLCKEGKEVQGVGSLGIQESTPRVRPHRACQPMQHMDLFALLLRTLLYRYGEFEIYRNGGALIPLRAAACL
jgi:hypothetical protein